MLIRTAVLKRIKTGEVSLAFRRWRKPTVKSGGTLNTAIGQLSIQSVGKVSLRQITRTDAKLAGFPSKAALMEELDQREGDIYKIVLAYRGADPRIALREDDELSDEQLHDLLSRLERMDARSRNGEWTASVMKAISDHPQTAAAHLAAEMGWEKDWLKANVRKLKNLGLTISHETGYSLSPRGIRVLKSL